MPIPSSLLTVPLEPLLDAPTTVHEGDPRVRGFTLHPGTERAGAIRVLALEPARMTRRPTRHEAVLVLEGAVRIQLPDGSAVDLDVGAFASVPMGAAEWTVRTPTRLYVVEAVSRGGDS